MAKHARWIALISALSACGAPGRAPAAAPPAQARPIRSVDFLNRTYPSCFEGEPPVRAQHGGAGEVDELGDGWHFTIAAVDYGDLDGDGAEEAVVLAQCQITAVSREGPAAIAWVFTMRQGLEETLLGQIDVHDAETARIRDALVLIEVTVRDEETLDPIGVETQVWRWDGRGFVPQER